MKKSFAQWMKEVNAAIEARCGMSSADLPDCPYAQWYEDGKTVKGAASAAIKLAGE